jgi:hypothetical protein
MPRYHLLVLTNPTEGREAEYNDWYTNQHLDDVLRVPGVIGAQRFQRTEVQRDAGPYPWKYLAVYECDANDVTSVIDGLRSRSGTPDMPISSALDGARFVCFFEPITDMKCRPAGSAG